MAAGVIFRYMCFVIWAHGLPYLEELIDRLEKDPDFEILIAKRLTGFDHSRFIMQVYGCDSYPIEHLCSKLAYLKSLPSSAVFLFVKSFNTDGEFVGVGPFRAWQAESMVKVKRYFREKYNPRNADGSMSHDHIIHGTDNEAQTDYLLKLLGYAGGVHIFEREAPFAIPHHIQWAGKYRLESVTVNSLRANILSREGGRVVAKIVTLAETPQYLGIAFPDIYEKYLHEFQYTYLCDHYSLRKYAALQQANIISVLRKQPVVVRCEKGSYRILDGVHRASVAMAKGVKKIPAVIIQ